MIKVSKHIKGKAFAVSDCTDTRSTNFSYAEMLAFKNNFKPTCFDYVNDSSRQLEYMTGVIDFAVYTYLIYNNINSGDATGLDTYIADITTVRNGKTPTCFSYANGQIEYFDKDIVKTRFLGGRNSQYGNNRLGRINYKGLSRLDNICRDITMRWNYYTNNTVNSFISGSNADGIYNINRNIDAVRKQNGWFTNFQHWHWSQNEDLGLFSDNLKLAIGNSDYISASFNDMFEYYYTRESVSTIVKDSDTQFTINYSENYADVDYSLITTPLYVEIHTKGTSLENEFIKTSEAHKIYKKSDNIFIIAIPLNFALTSKIVTLEVDASANYVNEDEPIVSLLGTILTSDQPIKSVVYRKTKVQTKNNVVVIDRQNTLELTKTLPIFDTVTYDYYIGYINENGTSGILEIT